MKILCAFASIALAISGANQAIAQEKEQPVTAEEEFDAQAAWEEFEGIFRLFYAYSERTNFDVEAVLANSKKAALQATDKHQFRKILHQTALTFSDPHFIIGPFDDSDYSIIPTGSDIIVKYARSKFVVADVRAGSAADSAGIRPGWEIITINSSDINTAPELVYGDLLTNPTDRQIEYAAKLLVSGKRNQPREIIFNTGSQTVTKNLAPTYDYSNKLREEPLLETDIVNGIAVIRINNSLGNNDLITAFDEAMLQVADSDGLIIDLRGTPSGGNTEVARSIIGHFTPEIRSYQIHEIPSLEREFTVPRRFIEQVKPRDKQYTKPLVVLGGYWTGSMGEGLVIGLDAAANAYVIASDMGDLLGALSNFNLEKSGARIDMGTEKLFHVNGTPREDYVGDLPLDSADRDQNGEDPAMRVAMEYFETTVHMD